jgi:ribose transport system ATP-binding protein
MGSAAAVVSMRGITKRYGGVIAVDNVDLDIYPGEVHVVAGENGAGKSTLMKLLAQVETVSAGTVLLEGAAMEFHGPRTAQRLGVAMVHQELALAPDLSVADNVFLGREPGRYGFISVGSQLAATRDLLERAGLRVDPRRLVRGLSVAQQQQVEIAKALAVAAKVLIMDEPTATFTDSEIDELFRVIETLRRDGIAVLYISHRLEEIFRIADRVTVMRDGRIVATRPRADLDQATLVRLMVGRDIDRLYPRPNARAGEVMLRVQGLRRGSLGPCSFEVRAGEVVGLAGLVGSGRTELARAVYGADRADGGRVEVRGTIRRIGSPSQGIASGIGYLSEDRKRDGLAVGLSVAHNITMARPPVRRGLLRLREERRRAERRRAELDIRTPSVHRAVRELSGGNQQKVAVAKLLETDAEVLLLDEPARGIDVAAKAEMFALVARFAEQGRACVLISSYLPELLAMCDRILVMRAGRIAGELPRTRFSEEAVMALATGAGEE